MNESDWSVLRELEESTYTEAREEFIADMRTDVALTGSLAVGATVFVELSRLASRLDSDAEMLLVPLPAIVAAEFAMVGIVAGLHMIGDIHAFRRQKTMWTRH